ncbi:SseB family protein [Rhodosalinus sediminis]|uniref:SseB family protein n=1 Tax=Rhodosalinus sediminis TaxID=1940533 RepID=A0A3D9BZ71_9RHOB|nr:SseB family protein [Rhodosalinus sediminis]REC58815.1 SseB family protein [Rhodosalinus sediminis]
MDTPLDQAHAAMEAAPEDEGRRRAFYDRLALSELYLLLDHEAEDDRLSPRIFPLEEGRIVVAFDLEERLSAFAGGAAPYAALSGRTLARMLAGEGLGLGLNLEAHSAILLPGEAMAWLAERAPEAPRAVAERPVALHPPGDLPEGLLAALDARLATAGGRAGAAWLAEAEYAGGGRAALLAFTDVAPGADGALAQAAGEALAFSGLEAGWLDLAFAAEGEALAERLAAVALRIDLPAAEAPDAPDAPAAPGQDPDRPPRLR